MLMNNILSLHIHPQNGDSYPIEVDVKRIGCSRNASRDVEAAEKYLEEFRTKGYKVHEAAGVCFRSRYLLTNEDTIEVQGAQTSGEVEFVAIRHKGNIYISTGSDHNDRSLENLQTEMLGKVFDSAKLKQMVPAVVAKDAWRYDDIKDHWDEIVLKSFVTVSNQKTLYQEFKLSNLLDLEYYIARDTWLAEDGSVLLGGSSGGSSAVPENIYQGQSTLDGVVFPTDFHFEMFDPVLDRTLSHGYDILSLEQPGSFSL